MLQRALDSIVLQSVLPKKIFLVIDEAEGENDYSFLCHYSTCLQVTYTGGGCGGAGARNLGLEQLNDEDYVFFLDDDDEWCTSKVAKQIEKLENHKNTIGVTCWNYKVAHQTEKIERIAENLISKYIVVWNTLGSFSFFGYRLTAETRKLRLWEDLAAAQDWEFYIQLSAFGEFAVIEEYLAHYYAHNEKRITGDASVKMHAWKMIYQKHRNHMSVRQRWFHLARINWKKSENSSSILSTTSHAFFAIVLSILSFHQNYSFEITKSSTSSLLARLGIRAYKS